MAKNDPIVYQKDPDGTYSSLDLTEMTRDFINECVNVWNERHSSESVMYFDPKGNVHLHTIKG